MSSSVSLSRVPALLLLSSLAGLTLPANAQHVSPHSTASSARPQPRHGAGNSSKVGTAPAASVVTVTVRAGSDVSNKTFTLGEIAAFEGSDKTLLAQLAQVEIGASPMPGLSRLMTSGDVIVHLRHEHLAGPRVELLAPPTFRVNRVGHEIGADEITKTAIAGAQDALKSLPNASLEPTGNAPALTIEAGKARLVAGAWTGKPEAGSLVVPVSVFVDGKLTQTVEVTLRVHRKSLALVARRTLQPHEIVSAEDVVLSAIDLPPGFEQPIATLDEAIGKRTTRRLPADAPIPAGGLETPPVVAANDRVTIETVFGTVRITAPGLARSSGAVGDIIHVYETETHKELDARIIDSHTVRIETTEESP